jgi:hypothetical protein
MILREVNTKNDIAYFHSVGKMIYRNSSHWVPAVANEIEMIFAPEMNTALKNGNRRRFVLLDRDWEPVGRIAAFYNRDTAQKKEGIIGGIGFYECVDNIDAAKQLFESAESWLRSEGMTHVDAPVNFGERHQFYGLLVNGNEHPHVYQENYNPAYYTTQFSMLGYPKLFDSFSYILQRGTVDRSRLEKLNDYLRQRHSWTFRMFEKDHADSFIADYLSIAQHAFQLKNRTVKIDAKNIQQQLNIQMNLINPSFIWFAYAGDRPIGVIAHMMNYNDLFNGAKREINSIKSFLIAIVPEFQQKGLAAALCWHSIREILKDEKIELAHICGIAEFSSNIQQILIKLGAERTTVHRVYRKSLFTN